jgi:hypothetical protein
LALSNTSLFLTWSVQLIFSILLQHHISKLSRCFWSTARSVQVSAPKQLNFLCASFPCESLNTKSGLSPWKQCVPVKLTLLVKVLIFRLKISGSKLDDEFIFTPSVLIHLHLGGVEWKIRSDPVVKL